MFNGANIHLYKNKDVLIQDNRRIEISNYE